MQQAIDLVRDAIVNHPSRYGEVLAGAAGALVALWLLIRIARVFRRTADPAVRTLLRFFRNKEKGDLNALAQDVAIMKFDRSGRVDDWFVHASVARLATFQANVGFVSYVGKEPRRTTDGGQVGGMLAMKVKARHSARGTYEAMVFMGMRPGVPFDGKWKVLVQDFIERAGPYEGPTAVYTYKPAKLSPVGDALAKAWKQRAKPLKAGGHVLFEPPKPRKEPPKEGPMQEPSPHFGGLPKGPKK